MMRAIPALNSAALLLAAAAGAQAQNFALEGAVIDSRNSKNLGVINERGDINTLFRAQKAMTFGILRSAGISLDQLPPDIRARIERFQTTNVEAFRAYSQGLDLKDQGKFVEAKAQFRRAAELDPGFALAVEQQQSMPDVNLGVNVATRAAVAAAAGAAVDRGKASVVVDTAQALAALASGVNVVLVNLAVNVDARVQYSVTDTNLSSRPPLVAGYAYGQQLPSGTLAAVASAQEWLGNAYRTNGSVLESLGTPGDFLAQRQGASAQVGGSVALSDGSTAYWGSWLSAPGASATVSSGTSAISAPVLGQFDYVFGNATPTMPTIGTASYTASSAGTLGQPTGQIQVDFGHRLVTLQNLAFNLGSYAYSGLNGSANYGAGSASGGFLGSYSSGVCTGCAAGSIFAGSFNGAFIGRNADGLAFATSLQTGYAAAPFVSGVHLFTKP